jgi:hypothetical protein
LLSLTVALLGADSRAASAVPASTSSTSRATIVGDDASNTGPADTASPADTSQAATGSDAAPDTTSAAS